MLCYVMLVYAVTHQNSTPNYGQHLTVIYLYITCNEYTAGVLEDWRPRRGGQTTSHHL